MIGYHQAIHERNVVSCLYQVDLVNLSEVFADFIATIIDSGYTPVGPLFYSINSDLRQTRDMIVEVFIPIEEEKVQLDKCFNFRTYFQLLNLMVTRVAGDSEQEFSKGIELLIEQIIEQELTITTPSFYRIHLTEDGRQLTDIMIGVRNH